MEDVFAPEDLHPDLVPYVGDGSIGPILHHPLVIEVMYDAIKNKMINKRYTLLMERRKKLIEEQNWASLVFQHERPYRLSILSEVLYYHEVPIHGLWNLIGQVWTDSENIHQNLDEWREIWDITSDRRREVMDEDEQAAFDALPDRIPVYRGYGHEGAEFGISWTTDRNVALWFANRFKHGDRVPYLASGIADKSEVLAHFLGRNEKEIVIMPESVNDMEIIPLEK